METIEEKKKITYVDGLLRGYSYMQSVIRAEQQKIDEIEMVMSTGGVHSITWDEPSLAACNAGTGMRGSGSNDRLYDLMELKDQHEQRRDAAKQRCKAIDIWMDGLEGDQGEAVRKYYREGKDMYRIGDEMYMARNSVRARIHKALLTFPA